MAELRRILYVEDEPDIQAITIIILSDVGGFDLKSCSSGEEAITVAVDFKPDILLLDVMMPGLDGPSTLGELRKFPELKETPAIFMTAKVQADEVAEYKALGVLDVIAKPYDPMTLVDRITDIWKHCSDA